MLHNLSYKIQCEMVKGYEDNVHRIFKNNQRYFIKNIDFALNHFGK
jgi:hypothetical protein